jgi:hypothetical protein
MGSRQTAVKAFLVSCHNKILLDQWIPDEDWVCQIRDNGERDNASELILLFVAIEKQSIK